MELLQECCWSLRRAWQPTPVFLPGESHGQGSLASYSPWGCKESDTTEPLNIGEDKLMFSIAVLSNINVIRYIYVI